MTFAQRSFVVIYLKVTVLKNSSVINSLDVSSPASKRVLRVNLFQAVRMDSGNWEPLMSCSNQFQCCWHAACQSKLIDFPLQVL